MSSLPRQAGGGRFIPISIMTAEETVRAGMGQTERESHYEDRDQVRIWLSGGGRACV